MRMKVNASNYTAEEVLSMKYEDEQWRLVACLSKSLNKTKINYEIHDRNASSYSGFWELKTSIKRHQIQVQGFNRSQEFKILYKSTKTEL